MVNSPPQCSLCTIKNGVQISKSDGKVLSISNSTDIFRDRKCPQNFQCVGHEIVGCCHPCSYSQSCPEGTIAHSPLTFATDNECPAGHLCDPHPSICPIGTICWRNIQINCTVVQQEARWLGYDKIHDGAFCAEGSTQMGNCPTGYYCPDAKSQFICPKGSFCPMKTSIPEIECASCKEGSMSLVRSRKPFYVTLSGVFVALIIYVVLKKIHNRIRNVSNPIHGRRTLHTFSSDTNHIERLDNEVLVNSERIRVEYKNLSVTIKSSGTRKRILDSIDGSIESKKLYALIGGSGAGKSTFLNVLSARQRASSGVFTLNGRQYSCHEWYTLISGHHFQIGFVPQDDQGVYSEFTVFQNLFWAGRFQLPHQTSNDEVRKLADSVIFSLGLDLVRDTRVGSVHKRGISGGERRRCSIGLSMMAKPHILFLDEPTSGLDASSSTTVITILKKLTKERNLSVLCSIHQPRQKIFSMFNSLIFLGNGGKLVYSGEAKLARPYFERLGFLNDEESNPADFLLDISSGALARTHHPKEIISDELSVTWKDMMMQFETPAINTTKEVEINKTNGNELRPPAFKQFVFQTQRCFLLMKKSLKVKVMDTLIIISGATLLTLLEGVVVLAHDFNEAPLPFHVLMKVKENPNSIPLKRMWYFSMTPINDWLHFGTKISSITGVLIALAAGKTLSDKRLHVEREFENGYFILPYYIAESLVCSVEHCLVQMAIVGAISYWLRHPISSLFAYILNFIMLGWGMTSWGHLLAIIVPAENLTLTSGTFLLCSSLICGGVTRPVLFKDIYRTHYIAVIAGLLSPSRFFTETLVVSDLLCLPEQFGFTRSAHATFTYSGLDNLQLAQLDESTHTDTDQRTCTGWYWGHFRVFLIGLSVRMISLLIVMYKWNKGISTSQRFLLLASKRTFIFLAIATAVIFASAVHLIT